jgi:hypothetical protein
VLTVVHGFTALEQLAAGATRVAAKGNTVTIAKGAFLPPRVASAVELAALRRLLVSTLELVVEAGRQGPERQRVAELLEWLESPGQVANANLDAWSALLTATPSAVVPAALAPGAPANDAAAVIDDACSRLTPHVRLRVAEVRRLWGDHTTLIPWVRAVGRHALAHTDQARVARNRTVHGGLADLPGDQQIAVVTCQLLDCIFEVLPAWLSGAAPWQAMSRLHRECRRRRAAWGSGTPIVASRMCAP